MRRANKFRAIATVVDGVRFDSKAEARRWQELLLLERAGEIANLERQKRHELFGADGSKVCTYVADFEYVDAKIGLPVTEDVKSPATAKLSTFRLKAKLFAAQYGREISIVR